MTLDEGFGMLEILAKGETPSFFAAIEHTFAISGSVGLKAYSRTNLQNMKITELQ